MTVTADRKLWLTADRKTVVEDGDPKAAFLFATVGKEISDEDAKRYNVGTKSKAKTEDKQAAPAENKARSTK